MARTKTTMTGSGESKEQIRRSPAARQSPSPAAQSSPRRSPPAINRPPPRSPVQGEIPVGQLVPKPEQRPRRERKNMRPGEEVSRRAPNDEKKSLCVSHKREVKVTNTRRSQKIVKTIERAQESSKLALRMSKLKKQVRYELQMLSANFLDLERGEKGFRIEKKALEHLKAAVEAELYRVLWDAYGCTINAKRVTLKPSDIQTMNPGTILEQPKARELTPAEREKRKERQRKNAAREEMRYQRYYQIDRDAAIAAKNRKLQRQKDAQALLQGV